MLDEPLRSRLESLNRGPLGPNGAALSPGGMPSTRSDVGMLALRKNMAPEFSASNRRSSVQSRILKPIPGLLRRGAVVQTDAGEHWRIRLPLDAIWPGGARLAAARQEHLQTLAAESAIPDADSAALVAALPDRAVFLDLETCGLAGAALFLVGLLRSINGQPTVELLFARDYAEERAVLHTLWQTLPAHDVLVTFNGKTFDWPMVLERSTRHLMSRDARQANLRHVDVLHHARRRWRRQLPDCRLQTIEQFVCRRRRTGDIPGHRIPAIYADFVRTGFERDLDAVLFHNAVDLVTLLDLALRLAV